MKNINRTKQQYMSIPKIPTVANNNHKQTDRQNTHAHPRTNTQTNSSTPTPRIFIYQKFTWLKNFPGRTNFPWAV